MSYRTLNGFTIRPTWPSAWGTANVRLVVVLDRDVVSEDGVQYQGAQNHGEGVSLDSLGHYFSSVITVTDGVASAAAISNLPTTDTSEPLHTARYHVFVYVGNEWRDTLTSRGFHLHESVNGDSLTFSWQQWVNAQQFSQGNSQLPMIGDRATMQAMVDAALLASGVATTTALGRVKLSAAPLDALSPYAVETTDPRVPTQGENDALVGTSGSPSSLNRYVTDADTRLPTQNENNALAGSHGSPSSSNVFVTNSDPRLPTGEIKVSTLATSGDGTLASPYAGWNTGWAALRSYVFDQRSDGAATYYTTSTTVNWSLTGIRVRAEAGVTINYTGSGIGVQLQAPTDTQNIGHGLPSIRLTGLRLRNTGTGTYGFYFRNVYASQIDIDVGGFGTAQVYGKRLVGNEFRIQSKVIGDTPDNTGYANVLTFSPHALYIDDDVGGSSNENIFIVNLEGNTVAGIYVGQAIKNTFYGTCESNNPVKTGVPGTPTGGAGVVVSAAAFANTFIMDNEGDPAGAMDVSGKGNAFLNCIFTDLVRVRSGANNNVFSGGTYDAIQVDSGALNNLFENVRYSLNGGAFTDNSTSTSRSRLYNVTTTVFEGVFLKNAINPSYVSVDVAESGQQMRLQAQPTAGGNPFVGTISNHPFEFITNSTAKLRLENAQAILVWAPVLFANLGSPGVGRMAYCSDATPGSNPATGGGSGAFVIFQGANWKAL